MAHRNESEWSSYLPFGVGFRKLPLNFHHSNGCESSWRLTVVRGEPELRIVGLLGFLSQGHEAEIEPVRLEVVSRRGAMMQRLGLHVLYAR